MDRAKAVKEIPNFRITTIIRRAQREWILNKMVHDDVGLGDVVRDALDAAMEREAPKA